MVLSDVVVLESIPGFLLPLAVVVLELWVFVTHVPSFHFPLQLINIGGLVTEGSLMIEALVW